MFKLERLNKMVAILVITLSVNANAKMEYPSAENLDSVIFLNSSELKELYTEHTLSGKNLKFKKNMEIYYSKDGTYKGTVASGKKKISGTWTIENNSVCSKGKRGKKCSKLYKDGEQYIIVRENKMISKVKFK